MEKTIERNKKLKIDILTPIRYGGPQKWGDDLVRALKYEGLEARNIHSFFEIIKRIFYTNADIIHSTLPLFFTFHKKPVILTIHGNYKIENKIWKNLYKIAIKKAKKITVPSEFLKKEIDLQKVDIIPNGIFFDEFKEIRYKTTGNINLLTITKFYFEDKAKAILNIMDILEDIKKEKKINFSYTVVGLGSFLEEIKKISKKYSFKINFLGFRKDIKEIMNNNDIFLYYSHHDNLPIVILEAMASGLPVITNEIGAVGEIIENNLDGMICKDKNDYKKKLEFSMLNLEKRLKLGRNARKKIKSKFDWRNFVERYILLYKVILK